jgi:hypothetical protein
MENKNEADSANTGVLKKPLVTIFVIGVLSLATWYFFYLESMPLMPLETTFVVGISVVVVLFAKWLWARLHKSGRAELKH